VSYLAALWDTLVKMFPYAVCAAAGWLMACLYFFVSTRKVGDTPNWQQSHGDSEFVFGETDEARETENRMRG
jgi:hypothetical protein